MEGGAILVVDDDLPSREAIALSLRVAGHVVRTATNGVEAFAVARTEPLRLIVADLRMPVLDGVDLVRRLREHSIPVPVVLMSAGNGARERADAVGVRFLSKPFSRLELLQTIDAVLVPAE